MHIKLLASLAVVIALISAMTFVGLYGNAQSSSSTEDATTTLRGPVSSSSVQRPSPDVTEGSSDVTTEVEIGGGEVQTSVVIR